MKDKVQDFYTTFEGEHFYKDIPMICSPGLHELVAKYAQGYLRPGMQVLDVGCGQGALSLRLSDLGFAVDACDIIDRCKCKDQVRFLCTSAEQAHFESLYDGIFVIELIEHVESPYELLRQYAKNLKAGGYLFLSTPNVESDFSRIWFMMRGEHWHFRQIDFVQSGHIMPFHRFQLDYIRSELGLSLVDQTSLLEHRKFRFGFGFLFAILLRFYQKVRAISPSKGAVRVWVLRKEEASNSN